MALEPVSKLGEQGREADDLADDMIIISSDDSSQEETSHESNLGGTALLCLCQGSFENVQSLLDHGRLCNEVPQSARAKGDRVRQNECVYDCIMTMRTKGSWKHRNRTHYICQHCGEIATQHNGHYFSWHTRIDPVDYFLQPKKEFQVQKPDQVIKRIFKSLSSCEAKYLDELDDAQLLSVCRNSLKRRAALAFTASDSPAVKNDDLKSHQGAKTPSLDPGNDTQNRSNPERSLESNAPVLPGSGQVNLHSAPALPPEDDAWDPSSSLCTYEDEPLQPLYSKSGNLSNGLGAPPDQASPDATSNAEPLPSSGAAGTTTDHYPTTETDKKRPDQDVTEDNDGALSISKNSGSVSTRQQDPLSAVDCPTPIETTYTLPEQTEGGRSTVENPSTASPSPPTSLRSYDIDMAPCLPSQHAETDNSHNISEPPDCGDGCSTPASRRISTGPDMPLNREPSDIDSDVASSRTDNSITVSEVSCTSIQKRMATTCKRPIGDEDTKISGTKAKKARTDHGSPVEGNASAMGVTQEDETEGRIVFPSSCGGSSAAPNVLKDSTYVSEPVVGAGSSTAGPSTAVPPLRLSSSSDQSNERTLNAHQLSPSSSRPTVANKCVYTFDDQANPISSRCATTTNEVSPLYASNDSASYPSLPRKDTRIITTAVSRNLVDPGASLESEITYSCNKRLERKLSIGSHGNIENNKLTKPLCAAGINVLADPKSPSHPWCPSQEKEQPEPYESHKPSPFLHSAEVPDLEDCNPQSGSTPPMELNGFENLENVQDNERTPWLASGGASVYQKDGNNRDFSAEAEFLHNQAKLGTEFHPEVPTTETTLGFPQEHQDEDGDHRISDELSGQGTYKNIESREAISYLQKSKLVLRSAMLQISEDGMYPCLTCFPAESAIETLESFGTEGGPWRNTPAVLPCFKNTEESLNLLSEILDFISPYATLSKFPGENPPHHLVFFPSVTVGQSLAQLPTVSWT
ncbi:hypothetical protein AU210_016404 [Fusarium oxysporum f. sp. radicis-cucumerinum]|uniref:Uncharacterized protein n=1 Tax=Fusarium oxysporum f. sp. radicis-cucumerinum TaxID=327505 RepID=A0A2H3GAS7_FUSOX|nr:hypothetical protein AU210_016404 [Fusarium oxysporum f. sp. radicis-cucumerinum]